MSPVFIELLIYFVLLTGMIHRPAPYCHFAFNSLPATTGDVLVFQVSEVTGELGDIWRMSWRQGLLIRFWCSYRLMIVNTFLFM